jgi:hypothetical protein
VDSKRAQLVGERTYGDAAVRRAITMEDGGAIIEVRLPANDRAGVPEPALPASSRKSVIEGSVLLVEDEEAVLEFERDVLAGAGARVVTLMNGDEVKARLIGHVEVGRAFAALA